MAQISWIQIIDSQDSGAIVLPPPERQIVDQNHFVEVSYTYDKDSDTIERIKRTGKIIHKNKRISKEAQRRSKTMNKFGKVAGKEKGFIEKNITMMHDKEFYIQWDGLSKKQQQQQQPGKLQNRKLNPIIKPNIESKDEQKQNKPRKYIPPKPKSKLFDEDDDKYQIKISNLPNSTERNDIDQMIRGLFDTMYYSLSISERRKQNLIMPPRRFKINLIFLRGGEEKMAFVEMESEQWRQLAIRTLDGEKYGYRILEVDKALPRKPRF